MPKIRSDARGAGHGKAQLDKFKEAARQLGCDESEEAFDDALKRMGKQPPPPKADKPKKEKPGR